MSVSIDTDKLFGEINQGVGALQASLLQTQMGKDLADNFKKERAELVDMASYLVNLSAQMTLFTGEELGLNDFQRLNSLTQRLALIKERIREKLEPKFLEVMVNAEQEVRRLERLNLETVKFQRKFESAEEIDLGSVIPGRERSSNINGLPIHVEKHLINWKNLSLSQKEFQTEQYQANNFFSAVQNALHWLDQYYKNEKFLQDFRREGGVSVTRSSLRTGFAIEELSDGDTDEREGDAECTQDKKDRADTPLAQMKPKECESDSENDSNNSGAKAPESDSPQAAGKTGQGAGEEEEEENWDNEIAAEEASLGDGTKSQRWRRSIVKQREPGNPNVFNQDFFSGDTKTKLDKPEETEATADAAKHEPTNNKQASKALWLSPAAQKLGHAPTDRRTHRRKDSSLSSAPSSPRDRASVGSSPPRDPAFRTILKPRVDASVSNPGPAVKLN